jgi:hypothetical protein
MVRRCATTIEVKASHLSLISQQSDTITKLILDAAGQTQVTAKDGS